MESFVAFDVETARGDRWSICQIGIAEYRFGQFVEGLSWKSLVNPNCEFSPGAMSAHRIRPEHVVDSPTLEVVWREVFDRLNGKIVVAHKADFDYDCLLQASEKYDLPMPESSWVCTHELAKAVFCGFERYKLEHLCAFIGVSYNSHDALEDAVACATLLNRILQATGLNLSELAENGIPNLSRRRTKRSSEYGEYDDSDEPKPKKPRYTNNSKECGLGNPDGPFAGQSIVITKDLAEMKQVAAIQFAKEVGFEVVANFRRNLTYVVVGDALWELWQSGGEPTGKVKEALAAKAKMEAKGEECPYRIVAGNDWLSIVRQAL